MKWKLIPSLILLLILFGANTSAQSLDNFDDAILAKNLDSELSYGLLNQKPLVSDEWQFIVAPYLWFSGLSGDVAVNGQEANVDASFGDLFKQLDFAFQIHAEVMKGNYFAYIDETYMKLSIDQDINPDFVLPIGGTLSIELQMNTLEFGGGYRLVAEKPKRPIYLDFYGGGRWWILDIDQNIDFNILPTQSSSETQQWVDLIVGTRLIYYLTENILTTVRTDIGGFGIGSSSDFTWNIIANFGYKTGWYGITPYIGWRAMYVDYTNGSGEDLFKYNVWINGIQTGLGIRF